MFACFFSELIDGIVCYDSQGNRVIQSKVSDLFANMNRFGARACLCARISSSV